MSCFIISGLPQFTVEVEHTIAAKKCRFQKEADRAVLHGDSLTLFAPWGTLSTIVPWVYIFIQVGTSEFCFEEAQWYTAF